MMTNKEDARPFADLRKDAEEFRIKFDEDIEECLNFLNTRITSLIRDQDTFGAQGRSSVHQNALAEFSKAKYDIFISIKSLINTKEREWLDYIAEMKKFFIENVEIFLAGTKLEVKLPPSESASSHGPRKSPGNRKSNSTSIQSSFLPQPLINIAKKIPGLSLKKKDDSRVILTANDEEEMDIDEAELDRSQSRSRSSSRSKKLSNSGLDTSQSNSGKRNSLKKEINLGLNEDNLCVTQTKTNIDVSESENAKPLSSKARGRQGKPAEKKSLADNINAVNLASKMRKRRGKLNSSPENVVAPNYSSSTDENEGQTVTNENEIPVKGRRGRAAQKAKAKDLSVVASNNDGIPDMNVGQINELRKGRAKPNDLSVITQFSHSSTDENESQIKETAPKGRRGKALPKTKDLAVTAPKHSNSTDENEQVTTEVPLKGRRGRAAPKTNKSTEQIVSKKAVGRGRKAVKSRIEEERYKPGPSRSPTKVSFDNTESSGDELDVQIPLARPVKSAARRKTLIPNLEVISGADIIPGNPSRAKAKRKTISGVAELETAAPSKRLKVSQKTISSQEEESSADDNLLESDGNYSDWMTLKSIDGKVPTRPAIYELKVWRAKKPAFIGSCESLRQKLTLYKLKQNSNHKHLDKFIDRNYNDIQVRYEVVSSFDDAKQEVKDRISSFVSQHKTTPAYN